MDRHPDAAYLFGQDITPSENLSCSVDEAVHTEVAEPRIAQDGDHASPLPELARCLGGPNHAPTDPVLHTSGRVCRLQLAEDATPDGTATFTSSIRGVSPTVSRIESTVLRGVYCRSSAPLASSDGRFSSSSRPGVTALPALVPGSERVKTEPELSASPVSTLSPPPVVYRSR